MMEKTKEERVEFWMMRSRSTLNEIETLLDEEFLHTSASRIYYASFYAVRALLISNETETKTHAGTRSLFSKHFIKPEIIARDFYKFYSEIFDYRHEVDYDEVMDLDLEKIKSLFAEASLLHSEIAKLLAEKK